MTAPELAGYQFTEKCYQSRRSLVYRGFRVSDQLPVVVKFMQTEHPSFEELAHFRNQYYISRQLEQEGMVQGVVTVRTLERYQHGYALVMEDTGAMALSDYEPSQPLGLTLFFEIAVALADCLHRLQQKHIIHKDIKPQNILIHPHSQQIQLIDFSLATRLSHETQEPVNPNGLQGSLAYLSPEQTGRMNRGVDYRTDFYALGVTFYQLLSRQLPFQSDDPMALIHAHLAQAPTAVRKKNPEVPQMLSDVVMQLMAKTPEARYQSALGLRFDLLECQQQWLENGKIDPFPLRQHDVSQRFRMTEKLYGRDQEVAVLRTAFERASQGQATMVQVVGTSGIGKTALVNEVHKPIVRQRGYFIKGKFDQFKRDIPFSAWVQAFQGLLRYIRTQSAQQLQTWKRQLLASLDDQGQILIELLPDLQHIIGAQPAVAVLQGSAAQQRFNRLLQRFIQVFARREHPLVIFLDDLQWIDAASLQLLSTLFQEQQQSLLLIGAYRDNEVTAADPLMQTLDDLAAHSTVETITLPALSLDGVNQWLADTLSCPVTAAEPLGRWVLQKTQGNPFFSLQFVQYLHAEGCIRFDAEHGHWFCDMSQVQLLAVSDDVVALMIARIQNLAPATQQVLQLAACIGNAFELTTLAWVYEKTPMQTAQDLWSALQAGLILPITDVYQFYLHAGETDGKIVEVPYRFLHDRVQQAAYALIADEQKAHTHLTLGRRLKSHLAQIGWSDGLFDLVNQLNLGRALITDSEEKKALAALNLQAGQKAKNATAYVAAASYIATAIVLLPKDHWRIAYDFSLVLYEEAVAIAHLQGDYTEQAHWSALVLTHARTLLEKVNVYKLQILAATIQCQFDQAVATALPVLEKLGIFFPAHSDDDGRQACDDVGALMAGRSIAALANLPTMADENACAVMPLLSEMISPSYIARPTLYPLVVCEMMKLSISYGNRLESTIAYTVFGFFITARGNLEEGEQYAEVALSLLQQKKAAAVKAFCSMHIFAVKAWTGPLQDTLAPFRHGYQDGLVVGDHYWACVCAYYYCFSGFYAGKPLREVSQECSDFAMVFEKHQQPTVLTALQIMHQAVFNWLGDAEVCWRLNGSVCDENSLIPTLKESSNHYALCTVYLQKTILAFSFEQYAEAVDSVAMAQTHLTGVFGSFHVAIFHFYDALVKLAVFPSASADARKAILASVRTHQEKMHTWAQHAPMNFQHKWDLLEAERLRVTGDCFAAMGYYERAIVGAKTHAYLQEEALAYELAARFYRAWDKPTIADEHITQAYYAYACWGAKAKVNDLLHRYPALAGCKAPTSVLTTSKNFTASTTMTEANLDVAALMDAFFAISKETDLSGLLATLMHVMVTHAGAEKGVLMLCDHDQPRIKAIWQENTLSLDLAEKTDVHSVPWSLVQYVVQQRAPEVRNAVASDIFAGDPYILAQQPLSALCCPIMHREQLVGLLYLENALTADVFTAKRLRLLKMLSAQAAILLENAVLNEQQRATEQATKAALEQQVAARTKELEQVKQAAIAASAAKSAFLANMGHEIRTPMNAVIGLRHLLQSTALTPQQTDYLDKMQTSSNMLMGIINDLLDFSKIEAGKLTLEHTLFNLGDTLSDISTLLLGDIERKGLRLELSQPVLVPRYLVGDALRLGQILLNLLKNAVKFTEKGEIVLSVDVTEQQTTQVTLRFSVQDTGIGLTDTQIQRLFQPFSQADGSTTRLYGGTGLGLSIVKRLVQAMHGEIGVDSTPGQGSTFFFTARFGYDAQKNQRECEQTQVLQGKRVLVVDDCNVSRLTVVSQLERLNCNITEVASGAAAIAALQQAAQHASEAFYDLVLLDWSMPGMNGIETCHTIRTQLELPRMPIMIMVTGFAREEVIAQIKETGLDGFLLKPITGSVFVDTLMQAFGRHLTQHRVTVPKKTQLEIKEQAFGANILLVEDNAINQQIAQEMLEGVGFHVTVVDNGKVAVATVTAQAFDLVLMDIHMPQMDGYQATRCIRENASLQRLPIIAMTANAMASDKQACLAAGMNDHISKPIDPDMLYKTLNRWVRLTTRVAGHDRVPDKASAAVVFPTNIEAIDIDIGLTKVRQNRRLYVKILQQFRTDYRAVDDKIAHLQVADLAAAKALVHTLKGVSGNIGAQALYTVVKALELEMQNAGDLSAIMRQFKQALLQVMGAIARITTVNSPVQSATAKPHASGQIDIATAAPLLQQLANLLRKRNLKAGPCLEDIRSVLAMPLPSEFAALETKIDDFEFEQALALLQQMARKLNMTLSEVPS